MGKMFWVVSVCLFQLVVYTAAQTGGLVVQSVPPVIGGDMVKTKLKEIVSLTCESAAREEAAMELEWLRNGVQVSLAEGNKLGRSSLCVSPVTLKDHAAIFTCQLKGDASVNASVTLDITYAPGLSGSEEVSVEEEAELALECNVHANPVVSVSWQQHGKALDLSGGKFVVTNDGYKSRLTVLRVDRSMHQGTYVCVTSSDVHGTQSQTFNVTVTDKTIKFPLMPMIAGLVVVFCTILLAVVSRWKKITQCCK
ncbi:transmembrane and immunoglobulin domain-containing protein 1 [Hypomesus transpacificus]|uniref:transmembrane and immunoglobulin domain-containing protein 1 n=1 Tax=Hypomesus transpacificus TaxID=137520 RepID=UPI001F080100|nr:transmembrane and immunoglobulin domain-containing protein 1 [Hypomesus transpacificus]